MSLAREIQGKLRELQNQTAYAISNTERSGIRKPAPTVDGKVEQARQWLANPVLDDKGLGELCAHRQVTPSALKEPITLMPLRTLDVCSSPGDTTCRERAYHSSAFV